MRTTHKKTGRLIREMSLIALRNEGTLCPPPRKRFEERELYDKMYNAPSPSHSWKDQGKSPRQWGKR